jgi:hypothetical protein
MSSVVKVADRMVISGNNALWDSPMVQIGAAAAVQFVVVTHNIVGTTPQLSAQPATTDDLLNTVANLGSASDITTATTTRVVVVLTTTAFGQFVRVRFTLTGTTPSATFSLFVYAYTAL